MARDPKETDVRQFLEAFKHLYSRYRNGAIYVLRRPKDPINVRRLLEEGFTLERLEKLAVVMLTTDDEWISGSDRGIGVLLAKASALDSWLCEFESKHGPVARPQVPQRMSA